MEDPSRGEGCGEEGGEGRGGGGSGAMKGRQEGHETLVLWLKLLRIYSTNIVLLPIKLRCYCISTTINIDTTTYYYYCAGEWVALRRKANMCSHV